jgi:transposase
MEDLTGITTNVKDYFLKSWAYFQLQNYIKYKAEKSGIIINWVDPKDTSKMCPVCNQVNEKNRDKSNVTLFTCQNFLCDDYLKTKDADLVAAENISKKEGSDKKLKSKKGKKRIKEKI